jgi:hypothetical protein
MGAAESRREGSGNPAPPVIDAAALKRCKSADTIASRLAGVAPWRGQPTWLRMWRQKRSDFQCDGRKVAGGLGFEPRLAESESAVLPLDDPPTKLLKYCSFIGSYNGLRRRLQRSCSVFGPAKAAFSSRPDLRQPSTDHLSSTPDRALLGELTQPADGPIRPIWPRDVS